MHIPVLKKEALEYLDVKPGRNFIDCTMGEGGHSYAILEKGGKVLGIEWDSEVFKKTEDRDGLIRVNDSYVNLKEIIEEHNFGPVNGILMDLGMSSWHIGESKKGFSFLKDEPLDMRYSAKTQITAEEIVNDYSEKEIEKILEEYGEERFAGRIAKKIAEERRIKPIETTFQLSGIINRSIPYKYQSKSINPSTRVFQALRIAVNGELDNLRKALEASVDILEQNGRIAVISFHSLEDRIVKNFFKEDKRIKILTKKPIIPSEGEIKRNIRARSAKLRAAEKL